jgi:hypothetical protein
MLLGAVGGHISPSLQCGEDATLYQSPPKPIPFFTASAFSFNQFKLSSTAWETPSLAFFAVPSTA